MKSTGTAPIEAKATVPGRATPRRLVRTLALTALALLGIAIPATAASAADCPNEAIRKAQTSEALPQGTVGLPDCMALEMVSPPKKVVQPAFAPVFSPDGERIRLRSYAALADTPGLQNPFGDSYIATRTPGGWSTTYTSPPADADVMRGGEPGGGPYAYLPDFSRWLSFGVSTTELYAGVLQLYAGGLDGAFEPITPLLVPIDDSGDEGVSFLAGNVESNGSSLDLSTTVFRPSLASTSFLSGDPRTNQIAEPGGDKNNYLVDRDGGAEPSLELLGRDKDDVVYGGRCGTRLGGGFNNGRGTGRLNQGAISTDGERVFFSTRPAQPFDSEKAEGPQCDTANPLRIMVRTQTPAGPAIEGLIEGDDPEEAGDDLYQGASVDGSRVYFTSTRVLAGSDGDSGAQCSAIPGSSAGCDLYLYDSELPEGSRLLQVSAGEPGSPTPGSGAEVLSSITAISTDGSHAYFAAEGVLTTDANPEGDSATAGEPNLYVYADGDLAFIGTLADADGGLIGSGLWGTERSFLDGASAVPMHGAPEGGEGHVLVFASNAPLTSDDADAGARDLFRYDSQAGTLERLSKAAEGGSEEPAADVEARLGPEGDSPERPRWVSEDGLTVAFSTAEPLAPGDEDGAANPYLWKDGTLARLPGDGEMPTLSRNGSEIGFATPLALLPFDGDTATDVYVARTNGGFPNPAPPQICDPLQEGACQDSVAAQTQGPAAATLSFSGPGNRRSSSRCRKPKVRRKGRCVKPKRRAAKNVKRANRRQGAGK